MSAEDNYFKILDKISEIASSTTRLEAEMQAVKEDVSEIKREDARQNELLAQHIAGVQTNRERLELEIKNRESLLAKHEEASQQRYEVIDKRLSDVEFFPKLITGIRKAVIWLGGFAAAAYAISRFFQG